MTKTTKYLSAHQNETQQMNLTYIVNISDLHPRSINSTSNLGGESLNLEGAPPRAPLSL